MPGSQLFSATTALVPNSEFPLHPNWQGVDSLDWTIPAGTYWVAFQHVSGALSLMPGAACLLFF